MISRSQYKQMIGRAGRAGIDTSGESIMLLQQKDKNMVRLTFQALCFFGYDFIEIVRLIGRQDRLTVFITLH